MIKRYCDRCGKECGDTWYGVNIMAQCENAFSTVTTEAAMCTAAAAFARKKDYCRECMEELQEFLQKK